MYLYAKYCTQPNCIEFCDFKWKRNNIKYLFITRIYDVVG